jgi:molecular chaperone GrpE (heat shock protein)
MSLEIPVSLDLLPQIQHRLHRLTSQLDQMQARLDQLTTGAQDNNIQLDALLQTMLTPHAVQTVDERLAELTVQLDSTHEQIAQMREALSTVATQEQVSSLERALAGRDLLADVADSVKKLGRTQFKANTLGDTREQQIESALSLARELVTRREQLQERRSADDRLRLEELRSTARGDFAADLLPALDSIELALDAGQSLLARHRQQVEIWRTHYAAMQRDWQATHTNITADAASIELYRPAKQPIGFWQRLRRNLAGEPPMAHPAAPVAKPTAPETPSTPPSPPAELDLAVELVDATSSWLSGLGLVRDRFAALLAIEGIQSLQALGQPFDPRLHLAIEAEERSDAPPNTVVRVLRQGYRQRQRVLRYAEVVVSRLPVKIEARNSVEQDLGQDLEQDLEPDLEQDLEQDLEPDLMQDLEQDLEPDLEQDLEPDLEQDWVQDQEPDLEQDPESDMESKIWNRAWNPKVEKNDEQF